MLEAISTFLAAVLVLFICYLTTKRIGKGAAKKQFETKYMRVIDQMALGQEKYISVFQVGERYFLVGITSAKINVLKELSKEDLVLLNSNTKTGGDFKSILHSLEYFGKSSEGGLKKRRVKKDE